MLVSGATVSYSVSVQILNAVPLFYFSFFSLFSILSLLFSSFFFFLFLGAGLAHEVEVPAARLALRLKTVSFFSLSFFPSL